MSSALNYELISGYDSETHDIGVLVGNIATFYAKPDQSGLEPKNWWQRFFHATRQWKHYSYTDFVFQWADVNSSLATESWDQIFDYCSGWTPHGIVARVSTGTLFLPFTKTVAAFLSSINHIAELNDHILAKAIGVERNRVTLCLVVDNGQVETELRLFDLKWRIEDGASDFFELRVEPLGQSQAERLIPLGFSPIH